jgi:hypothetical protein
MTVWVFDLDNNLYPLSDPSDKMRVDDHIEKVMIAYDISKEEATIKTRDLYIAHG